MLPYIPPIQSSPLIRGRIGWPWSCAGAEWFISLLFVLCLYDRDSVCVTDSGRVDRPTSCIDGFTSLIRVVDKGIALVVVFDSLAFSPSHPDYDDGA